MPNFLDQFEPVASDYRHDREVARVASIEARCRVAAGEDELQVVRDVMASTVRSYLATPWCVWHIALRQFLTPADANELDLMISDFQP